MTPRRFLALTLPHLATDRLRLHAPELRGAPLATWTTIGNRRVLAGVDAPGLPLQPGQALADAQAMAPDLVLRPADPAADRAWLERLALWALRFTPLAFADPPDGLLLDVTGCTALFGGEAALLTQVAAGLARGGVTISAALAGGAEAAAALARAGLHGTVVPPGEERAAVGALPLSALRLGEACLGGLHRLGLSRIGEALRQPRAPLARRFGRELLDALDAVTGARPRPLTPVRPPPEFQAVRRFLEPIATRPAIERALEELLAELCGQLERAGRGARQVVLRAFRVDRDVQEVGVGTGLPSHSPRHLRRLFVEKLERLEPDLGFEALTLQAEATNPLPRVQGGLAQVGSGASAREALGELLDRLAQRLPVWRLVPVASHWPEHSLRRVGPFAPVPPPPGEALSPRPVALLAHPLPLAVSGTIPDRVAFGGTVHRVIAVEGPERIEPEWWRAAEDAPGRAYYRVALDNGARLWIACHGLPDAPGHWFLHGHLP